MKERFIHVQGARENNLKNVSIDIPLDQLVVFTGVSGSGKTSLVYDVLHAEGQRRYISSLSTYARQFINQMSRPDVDRIEGLPPTISVSQVSLNRNPRSTVGTMTELYDYFRLLFAKIGVPHCCNCGNEVMSYSIDDVVDELLALPEGTVVKLLAPIMGKKGDLKSDQVLKSLRKSGFQRISIAGVEHRIEDFTEDINLEEVSVLVDRVKINKYKGQRVYDSIGTVLDLTDDIIEVKAGDLPAKLYNTKNVCPLCNQGIGEIEPRLFSFNSPKGACEKCMGVGEILQVMEDKLIPDMTKSLSEGALDVVGFQITGKKTKRLLDRLRDVYGINIDIPYNELEDEKKDLFLKGTQYCTEQYGKEYDEEFEGMNAIITKRYMETGSEELRAEYQKVMSPVVCDLCLGRKLKPEALAVTISGKNIYELTQLPISELKKFFDELRLSESDKELTWQLIKDILSRLSYLVDVGVGYLTLSRPASTLSGGEAQRVRLATQIGSGVTGCVYILDEPSIGLHMRDNDKMISILRKLCDLGNSVLVVEHDESTMYSADCIVDMGPGAGEYGGNILEIGSIDTVKKNMESVTGAYLSKKRQVPLKTEFLSPKGFLDICGACENNLKKVNVSIPLGVLCGVTGVSGSGKSTLINTVLYKELADIKRNPLHKSENERIHGSEQIEKVILIDQKPIGKSPRSNPATYTGVFDMIRELFANTKISKTRGYEKGRFSFNVEGGRCQKCKGEGLVQVDMLFLPNVYVKCDGCKGRRYTKDTLEVRYKGKNISEVLEMPISTAVEFFSNIPKIYRKLCLLSEVGLGYIKLGQSATTLSGGEAQRLKLADELSRKETGNTLYILDEPTTGMHFADVHNLVGLLDRLVQKGNSVLVIEHNLDVIKSCDYIIDMGPEGGDEGGEIVSCGTPLEIAECSRSYTGQYLSQIIK